MKQGQTRIFDKQKLETLINLRRNGFAISSLSIIFCADKSSIRHHLHKLSIPNPIEVYSVERIVAQVIPRTPQPSEWDIIEGMRVNAGSNYADYLKRANIRPFPPRKLV